MPKAPRIVVFPSGDHENPTRGEKASYLVSSSALRPSCPPYHIAPRVFVAGFGSVGLKLLRLLFFSLQPASAAQRKPMFKVSLRVTLKSPSAKACTFQLRACVSGVTVAPQLCTSPSKKSA